MSQFVNDVPSISYTSVPFDHTYILYNPNDVISIISVQFSLLPIYIMVFYTSWFLITREIQPVVTVGGHLVNEFLNKVIKVIVGMPRPDFHKDFGEGSYGLTYGMPSAHSQFMGFFSIYFICIVWYKVPSISSLNKVCISTILLLSASLVAFSRVYLFYHSSPQVIVGVCIGSVMGISYFLLDSIMRDIGLVKQILNLKMVKFFFLKDTYYLDYHSFEEECQMYKD